MRIIITTAAIILIGLAAFIGYVVFFGRSEVAFEVVGPDQIAAGEFTTLTLSIVNRGAIALRDGTVTMTLPAGAALGESVPGPGLPRERIAVEDVPAGGTFRREIRIQFLGRAGEVQRLSALYLYRPENIQSKLTRAAEFTATVSRVPVAVTVETPERVNAGDEVTLRIGVDAEAGAVIRALALGIDVPPGFELVSADPAVGAGGQLRWLLGDLPSGTSTTITLRGVFRGEPEEPKPFHIQLGRYDPSSQSWLLLTETTATPVIASPFLLAQASIGGARRGALTPGEQIEGVVRYRNNLADTVQNLTVTLAFPERLVDLASVRAEGGFYDVTRRHLVWNPASDARLKELNPAEERTLGFTFTLKPVPPIRTFSDKNFVLPLTTTIDTGTLPPAYRGVSLRYQDAIEFKIASRLTVTARPTYYDSPVQNSGPLPPKVRAATSYTVSLQLGSGGNDIRDISLQAELGGGVEFKGALASDVGAVEFNPASRALTWRIGSLPAATGILRPHATALVALALTPAENQVGTSPVLLKGITVVGRDAFAETDLSVTSEDVTTELRDDARSNPAEWQVVP